MYGALTRVTMNLIFLFFPMRCTFHAKYLLWKKENVRESRLHMAGSCFAPESQVIASFCVVHICCATVFAYKRKFLRTLGDCLFDTIFGGSCASFGDAFPYIKTGFSVSYHFCCRFSRRVGATWNEVQS